MVQNTPDVGQSDFRLSRHFQWQLGVNFIQFEAGLNNILTNKRSSVDIVSQNVQGTECVFQ
uniref:Uncharacterized protein n=1 Tax=Anguilla anguilla TaxID=7936 RepID=A0A0E9SIB6_ANGAN